MPNMTKIIQIYQSNAELRFIKLVIIIELLK